MDRHWDTPRDYQRIWLLILGGIKGITYNMIRLRYYMAAGLVAMAVCGIASAQDTAEDKKGEITFNRLPNPSTPDTITPQEGNSNFWRATVWVLKATFACPRLGRFLDRQQLLAPKPPFFTSLFGQDIPDHHPLPQPR